MNITSYPYLKVSECKAKSIKRKDNVQGALNENYLLNPQVIWTEDNKTLTENEAPDWSKTLTQNNTLIAAGASAYGKATKVVIDASFSEIMPHSTSYWFQLGPQLKTIDGLHNLNTSEVVSMRRMFATCGTNELYNMNFNTSKVKSMEGMFADCSFVFNLYGIDNFDTHNVENMANMFSGCGNLQSPNLTNFNTEKVTDMSGMFRDCAAVKILDLRNFMWSNIRDVNNMFNGCTSLKTIHLKDFDVTAIAINLSRHVFDGITNGKVFVYKTEDECPNLRRDFLRMGFTSETGTIMFFAPQAIWTEGNNTLTFISTKTGVIYAPGDDYKGQKVTAVWSGSDVLNTPVNNGKVPWTNTVDGKLQKVVFDQSFRDARPKSTAYWFAKPRTSASSSGGTVSGLENLNTSEVTDMSGMFYNWAGSVTIDMRNHNTEKVTSMKEMFAFCKNVTLMGLNTSNVTNMIDMFANYTSESLDISDFNTNKVTNAGRMFSASSISSLTVGPDFQFKSLATKANGVFWNVTNMNVTLDPKSTTDPDVDVNVENAMINKLGFVNSTNGKLRINLRNRPQVIWTADNKTLTFVYTSKVYVGDKFNGYTVTRVWSDEDVTNSTQTDFPAWTGNNLNSVLGKVTKVVIDESFSVVKPKSTCNWFYLNNQLTTISGLEYLNTSEVVTMDGMFFSYGGTSLNVSNFNTSKVTTMNNMFCNCSSLTSLDLSNFDTGNVTNMHQLFGNCTALQTLTFSDKFKTQKVTNMEYMFYNCNKLASLDITSFDMSKVTNLNYMFIYCTSLKTLNISDFNVNSSVAGNSQKVFYKVTGLTVNVNQLEINCPNLRSIFQKLGFTSTTGTISFKILRIPKPISF